MIETHAEEPIETRYARAFSQPGAVQSIFPYAAKQEMFQMVEQIVRTDQHLEKIISTAQTAPVKAGFGGEELHAESFNLDAILKSKAFRAATER